MSNNKGPCSAATSENCGGCRGKFSNTEHKCRIDGCSNAFICSLCNPLKKGFHCEDNFKFGNTVVTCATLATSKEQGAQKGGLMNGNMMKCVGTFYWVNCCSCNNAKGATATAPISKTQ